MTRPFCGQVAGLTVLLGAIIAVQGTNSSDGTTVKCGVYMAPSSIPGAGLGMYAGDKYYKTSDTVTLGDTVIPIFEYEWNNMGGEYESNSFLWDEYTWNSYVFPGMEEEGEDPDLIMVASPGVGAAANSYLSLVNIEDSWIKVGRSVKGDSPGTGASSIYYGREFYATRDIPPGGEIFVDYGTSYFRSRKQIYGYLPLPDTYKKTDKLLKRYQKIKNGVTQRNTALSTNQFWKDYYDLVKSVGPLFETSRILNGLPDAEELIPEIMEEGGSSQQHFNRSIRELSWLEENGQCMDNIKVGNSNNPDAGRGAFANRFIPKGGLVAPAPLIHIENYNVMKIFSPTGGDEPGKFLPNREEPYFFQLLMNYCFGHGDSTLLLCPYGLLTAFINHSSESPNTRIQWSKEMRHPEWREMILTDWSEEYHTGLQIDFVALRDIEEDEEILIDYGVAWEEAWQKHVRDYKPRDDYFPAFELNEMEDYEYRTIDDNPYERDGVNLVCRGWYIQKFYPDQDEDLDCRIQEKLGDDRYRAELYDIQYYDEDEYTEIEPLGILWEIPSDALYFADLPYTRDHYQMSGFRHAMMIPDDMFPEAWKNLSA